MRPAAICSAAAAVAGRGRRWAGSVAGVAGGAGAPVDAQDCPETSRAASARAAAPGPQPALVGAAERVAQPAETRPGTRPLDVAIEPERSPPVTAGGFETAEPS